MEYKKLGKILGKIMILEAILMLAPLAICFIYKESFIHILAFLVPIIVLSTIGFLLQIPKPERNNLYQKEGFVPDLPPHRKDLFPLQVSMQHYING